MCGPKLNGVAADAEIAARESRVVAAILGGDEIADEFLCAVLVGDLHGEGHAGVGLDRTDAVNAADGGDDDDVVAFEDRARGGVAHAVDLLVNVGFFFDVGVGARHVRFRLVVVVITDEVLDCVLGEEAPELAIELGCERLVGRKDQGRALHRLDDLGHGESFARAGDAEEHLILLRAFEAFDQLRDRRRLITGRLVIRDNLEALAAFELLPGPFRAVRRPDCGRVVERSTRLGEAGRGRAGSRHVSSGQAKDSGPGAPLLGAEAEACRGVSSSPCRRLLSESMRNEQSARISLAHEIAVAIRPAAADV